MCGRYALYSPIQIDDAARAVVGQFGFDLETEINQRDDLFNIAPTQKAPVVIRGEKGAEFKVMRWGLVASWAKDDKIGAKMIIARVETVREKPAFRAAFKARRCLVPASGYFEWKGEAGHKQPFFIHDPEGDMVMFAGLWEVWRPPGEDADWLHTFTILTGEPGKVSGDIHDRQPVILPPEQWMTWLNGTPDEAAEILCDVPEAPLAYHAVSKAVGSPRNKGPELVQPIDLSESRDE